MLTALFDSLFGCSHRRTTFPISPRRSGNAGRTQPYVACLDCGAEFAYDWTEMRICHPVTVSANISEKALRTV